MAVTTTGASLQRRAGTFQAGTTFSAGTATTETSVSADNDYIDILGGTTTSTGGAINNIMRLADGVEGQEMMVVQTATGEASMGFTGTATGMHVFGGTDDWLLLKFVNSQWLVMGSAGATLATTT